MIDKNPAERLKLQQMLLGMGIECAERDGAEAGIRFCQEARPDIVVMEASGVTAAKEFLRLVRYQGRASNRPVVILYADKPDMASVGETIIEGAADFLVKPFDRDLLLFKLEQAGVIVN
ncbi:MAG: hypothetical protein KGO94_13075 [Alphaproteobacteria bacterium]|nr:hypothetical protein [Alphaproteobacteria bacterium]